MCRVFLYFFQSFFVFLFFFSFSYMLHSLSWRKKEGKNEGPKMRDFVRSQRLEVTDKVGTCSDSARFNGTYSTFMDSRK